MTHPMGCFRSDFRRPVKSSFARRQIVNCDDIPIGIQSYSLGNA